MSTKLSLRPLVIEAPIAAREFEPWLRGQSELVRRTTALSPSGCVYQRPWLDEATYVDPTALLIGGMIISRGCYVGPYAVIRLDEKPTLEPLFIDEESNVQDCAVIHSTTQHIGKRVIIAHQSIVHGARIEDDVTIYIQAVVDGGGTVIGRGCFLHQGSYVGKGINLPEGRYVEPGRKILTQAEADALPTVPEALLKVRAHVLEHNREHVTRHTESSLLCFE